MPKQPKKLMQCKRKRGEEPVLCVCGCGYQTRNFFAPGHDQTLRGFFVRRAPALGCVDWSSVPLCFRGGEFAKQIKEHRPVNFHAGYLGFEPKGKTKPCPHDKNPT